MRNIVLLFFVAVSLALVASTDACTCVATTRAPTTTAAPTTTRAPTTTASPTTTTSTPTTITTAPWTTAVPWTTTTRAPTTTAAPTTTTAAPTTTTAAPWATTTRTPTTTATPTTTTTSSPWTTTTRAPTTPALSTTASPTVTPCVCLPGYSPTTYAQTTATPTTNAPATAAPTYCQNGQNSTKGYPYCDCNSGYLSGCKYPYSYPNCAYSCSTDLPPSCFASQSAAKSPSFIYYGGASSTLYIYLYVVSGRGSYKFYLASREGAIRYIEPFMATTNSDDCSDLFRVTIPFFGGGWNSYTNGVYTTLNSTLTVATTDYASPFNRNIVFTYPLTATLLSRVTVTSSVRVQVSNPGGGSVVSNFKGGIISQSYDRNTGLYSVVYQTTTSYPALVTSFAFSNVSNTVAPSKPTYVSSENTISFDHGLQQYTQRFTQVFTLPTGCYFTGDYSFALTLGCDGSYTGSCDPSTGIFSDRVISESICGVAVFSNSLSTQLVSFSDSTYSLSKSTYAGTDKAYFSASIASSLFSISSVAARDVYAVYGNSTVVTFRSGGVDTNVKPMAAFASFITGNNVVRFEFIPSFAFALPAGEQMISIYAVVDVTWASGRRESMTLQATNSDSSTASTSITVNKDTQAKSSASSIASLTTLLAAVAAVAL